MPNYKTFRDYHLWVGLILLVPLSVIAATGFLWNHEKTLGIKQEFKKEKPAKNAATAKVETTPLTASQGIWTQHASAIDEALAASTAEWGKEIEIEKIELRQEPGYGLIVKVKAPQDSDVKPEEIVWSVAESRVLEKKGDKNAGTDWAKIVHDLHTGKFFSAKYGYFWSDSGALALLFLSVTGVVLYLIPVFKKRGKKKKAAGKAIPPVASPVPRVRESSPVALASKAQPASEPVTSDQV